MTHCYGYNRKTRSKFSKPFRAHGQTKISKTLQTYKIGDYVDILNDGAIHKARTYRIFHGRTGRVFNVNPRSIGVALHKTVRNRKELKHLNIRVEHIRPSKCRAGFIARVKENDKLKQAANKAGKRISTKRQPAQPREAHAVVGAKVEFFHPKIFREVF